MVWPFENNTAALEKKLAGRNIQADKGSRMFLVFTIALSVCMALSINLLSAGTAEDFKNTQRDKAQIAVVGITDEQSGLAAQDERVAWVGEYAALGLFYQGIKTVTPVYGDETYFREQQDTEFRGDIPTGKSEIMLPQNYIDFLGEAYEVGDTAVLDITGTGSPKEYTVTAIFEETQEAQGYRIYVGKELAKELAGPACQVTAYIRLNTDEIRSDGILDFARDVIKDAGIEEDQVNLTDYFAVMTGAVRNGIPLPVPLIALVTALLATMVVSGIFYTKIVKQVQMFGQLRTIGMTKRQIRRMAVKEGRRYGVQGIPIGIACGILVGFIGCPGGFRVKTALIYAGIAAVAAFIMVNIAIFKPVRVAMNISPVEGSKYLTYSGKAKESHKLHRKLTPGNLAVINLGRNKQKAAFTSIMLGLSGALLLATATAAGSIDARRQAVFQYYPNGTIEVGIKNMIGSSFERRSDSYGGSRLQMEENPLADPELLQKLEAVEGVEKITPAKCVYMGIQFPLKGTITSVSNYFPTLDEEEITRRQSILCEGTADYDKMTEENGIWVREGTAKLGDSVELYGRAPDGSTFYADAVVAGVYKSADLMEKDPVVPGSPYFIMTYDMTRKLTGITDQTGKLSVQVSDENFDAALSEIEKIAEENGCLSVDSIRQRVKSLEMIYDSSIKTYYMISVILFVFGGISLFNMLMADFQNRKREFGLLRAVGTTQKQLKVMLEREIRLYLSASLGIAAVCGGIFGAAVCGHLEKVNHCISLKLPWGFLAGLVGVLAVIYFIFLVYVGNELKKMSVLSAVRE